MLGDVPFLILSKMPKHCGIYSDVFFFVLSWLAKLFFSTVRVLFTVATTRVTFELAGNHNKTERKVITSYTLFSKTQNKMSSFHISLQATNAFKMVRR